MTEEEKKVVEYFKKSFESKTPPYWYDDTIENSEIKIKTLVNLIEKLQSKINKRDNEIIEFNTSGIKCKNKDIHCPTSKETLDYYENFLIPGYEEEIKKLKKENEELKNKVVKRDKELIKLEEYANKNFERKDDVKAKYIPKDKIRDFIKRLEKDVENIREKKKDSHDYDRSSSRIQAYLTKTREIIKRLKELLEEE